jgi:signal transduction histidine kinase
MKLRTKLVALSLLTLLLPWSGWKLLQELERFLRDSQQNALLATAHTTAAAIPLEFGSQLLFLPDLYLPLKSLQQAPALDGYNDDWPSAWQGLEFSSGDGKLRTRLLAASYQDRLFVLFDVDDASRDHARPAMDPQSLAADGISLQLRSPRGLFSFTISPEAPGPLQINSERGDSGQVEGYWLERENGYRVELSLPIPASNTDLSFQVWDARQAGGDSRRTAGPMGDPGHPPWINLSAEWQGLSEWLAQSGMEATHSWLVDSKGWVLADSGPQGGSTADSAEQRTTWLQRVLYLLVAGSRTELLESHPEDPVHPGEELVNRALAGEDAISWTHDLETAVVWNTVAVPVMLEGEIHGAVVMQSSSDGLLLVTNRALSRLLFTTLALTFGLAAGLWFFATRLSGRVQRLSGAVSRAMESGVDLEILPLREDRDELGELARNNQKLLRAVANYSQYLQTLAGKLSHELKTPLAITRSSLDNLASQDLDSESRRFLERAQEGVNRQAAIVRAMSEASRLEAAIGAAEWETIDLSGLLRRCAEGYRAVHPGRKLLVRVPDGETSIKCAPDLLAQALDKLVDNAMSLSNADDDVSLILLAGEGCFELCVRNTGSSLPREFPERLFDSLVSMREKRGAEPHLGLGLYIVRLVAEAHNGRVSACELPGGKGVEFRITLPV